MKLPSPTPRTPARGPGITSSPGARGGSSARSDQVAGEAPAEHLGDALGDAKAAHLAVPVLQRQLGCQADAAADLHGAVYDAPRGLRREPLGHVAGVAHVLALVVAPGGIVDHQPR